MNAPDPQAELQLFTRLDDGECHYRLAGPAGGRPILMIHGATVPGWEFDRLAPLLNAAGFMTIVPDLYGHGYSARPNIDYDYQLFCRQMDQLLAALSIASPVDLFGHSMGAAIAARLANRYPGRYRRLALAAPLLDFAGITPASKLLALPGLGELLMPLYIEPMLIRRRRKRYQHIEDGRWVGMFKRHIAIPGFGRMMLSLLRCDTLGDQSACYAELQNQQHPLLVLRGEEDTIMPRRHLERLRELIPRADFVEIAGTPHAFVISDPEKLAPMLIGFYSRPDR